MEKCDMTSDVWSMENSLNYYFKRNTYDRWV